MHLCFAVFFKGKSWGLKGYTTHLVLSLFCHSRKIALFRLKGPTTRKRIAALRRLTWNAERVNVTSSEEGRGKQLEQVQSKTLAVTRHADELLQWDEGEDWIRVWWFWFTRRALRPFILIVSEVY